MANFTTNFNLKKPLGTEVYNIENDNGNMDLLDTALTDTYTKTQIDNLVSAVYKFKGSVANFASLPSTDRIIGDVWNVTDTGINYAWTSSAWDDIGGVEALATASNDGLMSSSDFSKLLAITGTNTGDETVNTVGGLINGATAITTPVDADLTDIVQSSVVKKITWANIKATLKTYFDTLFASLLVTEVSVTASRTLILTDKDNKMLACNHATVAIVNTIPLNASVAFPIGTQIAFSRDGVADVSIALTAGVTITNTAKLKIANQGDAMALVKTGTNTWKLFGSLKA